MKKEKGKKQFIDLEVINLFQKNEKRNSKTKN